MSGKTKKYVADCQHVPRNNGENATKKVIFARRRNKLTIHNRRFMINYLEQLQGTIKNNWGAKALSNFQGEDFTFGELATTIEEFHCFFR